MLVTNSRNLQGWVNGVAPSPEVRLVTTCSLPRWAVVASAFVLPRQNLFSRKVASVCSHSAAVCSSFWAVLPLRIISEKPMLWSAHVFRFRLCFENQSVGTPRTISNAFRKPPQVRTYFISCSSNHPAWLSLSEKFQTAHVQFEIRNVQFEKHV